MKTMAAVLVYLFVAFMTFGHVFNSFDCETPELGWSCRGDRQVGSVLSGAFWPVYWGGAAAIEVTKTR